MLETLDKDDRVVDITHLTLGDNDELIQKVDKLLLNLRKDPIAQRKAKAIAYDCLDKLVFFLKKI